MYLLKRKHVAYSIGGEPGSNDEGMIPRSVRLVFATCEAMRAKGWTYKIEASFLEIYNEQIRDLLGAGGTTHEIRLINNEVVVTNLKVEFCGSTVYSIYSAIALRFECRRKK